MTTDLLSCSVHLIADLGEALLQRLLPVILANLQAQQPVSPVSLYMRHHWKDAILADARMVLGRMLAVHGKDGLNPTDKRAPCRCHTAVAGSTASGRIELVHPAPSSMLLDDVRVADIGTVR